jgi:predicted NUDIX family phosphoesterase
MEMPILAISRKKLYQQYGYFGGISTLNMQDFFNLSQYMEWLPRGLLEPDPNYKQIIPYIMVYHNLDENGVGDTYLRHRRSKQSGETRLHGKYAMGIGGHIEPFDYPVDGEWLAGFTDLRQTIEKAARRETAEELQIGHARRNPETITLGLINDDSNPVSSVHLGVLMCLHVDYPDVSANDEEMVDLKFCHRGELYEESRKDAAYEGWARLVAEYVGFSHYGELPKYAPQQ